MSDGPAEDELSEELAAAEEPRPEEYEPDAADVSDETGTVYDEVTGEAETTPHDDEPEDES